jgi:RNA polymerase sigma-70 factor (ECF subfamily)
MDPFDVELLAALPKLRRVARYLTKNPDQVEDLVQDTIERGLRGRESFVLGTNMGAWLSFIARNCWFTDRRKAWRWQQMPMSRSADGTEVEVDLRPTPATQHIRLEIADLLIAISYLPPLMREAVLLAGEGLSYEEMSVELGCEVGTVKSRVSRGRDQINAYFGNQQEWAA